MIATQKKEFGCLEETRPCLGKPPPRKILYLNPLTHTCHCLKSPHSCISLILLLMLPTRPACINHPSTHHPLISHSSTTHQPLISHSSSTHHSLINHSSFTHYPLIGHSSAIHVPLLLSSPLDLIVVASSSLGCAKRISSSQSPAR